MLKPKKGFVSAQLNIEKLTPLQWAGIMRAMDNYAEHYYEVKLNEVITKSVEPITEFYCRQKSIGRRDDCCSIQCDNCKSRK